MIVMKRREKTLVAIVAALVAATAAVLLSVNVALADTVLNYDANQTSNPVADNITRLNVNKLDKDAHEYVKGAHLCIIEKETGRVVTEWVSDGTVHEIARNTGDKSSLDIDKHYILRELEAPENYTKAADTEFVIHSEDFNTTGEIISGPDAEFDVISGHGDVQAFVINLYDQSTLTTEEVETVTRERENETGEDLHVANSTTDATNTTNTTTNTAKKTEEKEEKASEDLPLMSDETSYPAMAAVATTGVASLAVGFYLTRRQGCHQ